MNLLNFSDSNNAYLKLSKNSIVILTFCLLKIQETFDTVYRAGLRETNTAYRFWRDFRKLDITLSMSARLRITER